MMMDRTIRHNLPIVQASCVGLDDLGQGICKEKDNILFARGLLPGEEGEVQLRAVKGKVAFGDTIKVTKKSPDRIKCPFELLETGICDLGHLRYEKRLEYKQKLIQDLIDKFAHLQIDVRPTIPCPVQEGFRYKIQRPVKYDVSKKKLVSGYYRIYTHRLVEIEDCPIENKLANNILLKLLALLNKYNIPAYEEDKGEGLVRHVLIRASYKYPEALVTVVVTDFAFPHLDEITKELALSFPQVQGVVLNLNKRKTNVILGLLDKLVYGKERIKDEILGKTFLISSRSFYQTNPIMLDKLYSCAIEALHLKGDEKVLDAYCGTGTIGICLADKVQDVTGVEIENSSYEDAKENASLNNVNNIEFILDDATEYMEKCQKTFDVVILDPPRKGTTKEFIRALFRIKPKKVVYISCDPSTLARDLNILKKEYRIVSVQGVDMFPSSHHIETVVSLERL